MAICSGASRQDGDINSTTFVDLMDTAGSENQIFAASGTILVVSFCTTACYNIRGGSGTEFKIQLSSDGGNTYDDTDPKLLGKVSASSDNQYSPITLTGCITTAGGGQQVVRVQWRTMTSGNSCISGTSTLTLLQP